MNSQALSRSLFSSLLEIKVHQKSKSVLHILKTDIQNEATVKILAQILDIHPSVKRWSVDLEDIDNVLRVECIKKFKERDLIKIIHSLDIKGEALEE